MLITSRETKRWVLPKGNPIAGLEPHQAAAQEAFEEAGIHGKVSRCAFAEYCYDKRLADGSAVLARVAVFPLSVAGQADNWPERTERETRWFTVNAAAAAVEEADLAALIRAFGRMLTGVSES